MVNFLLRYSSRCFYYLQLHRFMRWVYRKKIIILAYHGFTDRKTDKDFGQDLHLDAEKFRAQAEYLKKYYNVIPLGLLTEHYTSGAKIPDNSVVITIDDGYESSYKLAYPVLKQLAIPAAIFLTTDFIDKKKFLWNDRIEYAINMTKSDSLELKIDDGISSFRFDNSDSKKICCMKIITKLKLMSQESRDEIIESLERRLDQKLSIDKDTPEVYRPLEWDEVLEMVKSGTISIGCHTCSHVILTRSSPGNMEKELFLSKQLIEKKTGLSCRLFSYPNGEIADFDYRTKKLLRKLGYSCGLTTVAGMNDERSADVFELKRLAVKNKGDLIVFIMTLSKVVKFLENIKQLISNIPIRRKAVTDHDERNHDGYGKSDILKMFENEDCVKEFETHRDYNLFSRRRVIFNMLKNTHFGKIADIGCGSGGYLDIKKQHDCIYFGLDFSKNMIKTAKEIAEKQHITEGAFFQQGDVESAPYADNFFDLVLAIGLIEYFKKPDKLIEEIRRILKKDGTLIMQSFIPNTYVYYLNSVLAYFISGKNNKIEHKQYTKKQLDNLLIKNGFQIVDFSYSNFHLLPSPFYRFFPKMHGCFSEYIARNNPKKLSFFAVNYIGKYRLIKK